MSETPKWTPGPWKAGHYLGGAASVDRVAPNGDRLCHVADCHAFWAAPHDAHLIASAPALYEALEEFVTMYRGLTVPRELYARFDKAEKALALARGEEP